MKKNKWWGYQHINDKFQVKRYWDERDLTEAHESTFVRRVCPKFMAKDRDEAMEYIKKYWN